MELFGNIFKVVKSTADVVCEKTDVLIAYTTIKFQIANKKKIRDDVFCKLGQIIYSSKKCNSDNSVIDVYINEIDSLTTEIYALELELAKCKNEKICCECGNINSIQSDYCSKCGNQISEKN